MTTKKDGRCDECRWNRLGFKALKLCNANRKQRRAVNCWAPWKVCEDCGERYHMNEPHTCQAKEAREQQEAGDEKGHQDALRQSASQEVAG